MMPVCVSAVPSAAAISLVLWLTGWSASAAAADPSQPKVGASQNVTSGRHADLNGKVEEAVAALSRPVPDNLEGPLPAGTVVQAVECVDGIVRIDLQVSVAEGSLLLSMAEVEAIVEYLTAAIDPQRDLAGVVVRCRGGEADQKW